MNPMINPAELTLDGISALGNTKPGKMPEKHPHPAGMAKDKPSDEWLAAIFANDTFVFNTAAE